MDEDVQNLGVSTLRPVFDTRTYFFTVDDDELTTAEVKMYPEGLTDAFTKFK